MLSLSWIRGLVPTLLNFSKKTPAVPAPVIDKTVKKPAGTAPLPYWLSELADVHTTLAESSEFVERLKEDFFSHRVFLFTPKGDVIDLPMHSTPIDFAYAIHSDLGDHMVGAKVNGKMVSFDTPLRNGDIVDIMKRDSGKPTAKWLDMAKTSVARKHIRSALDLPERAPVVQPKPDTRKLRQKLQKKKPKA